MTLAFLVRAVRRHLPLFLVSLVLLTASGIGVGSLAPKTYTSHADMLLGLELRGSGMDPQTANTYLKDRVATYAELVTSDEVVKPVASGAGLAPERLAGRVNVAVPPDTVVLDVSVSGSSRGQAVDLTQAVVDNFTREVSAFNVRTGGPRVLTAQLSSPQPAVDPDQLHGGVLAAVSGLVAVALSLVLVVVVALVRGDRVAVDQHQTSAAAIPDDGPAEGTEHATAAGTTREASGGGARRRRTGPQSISWTWSDQ